MSTTTSQTAATSPAKPEANPLQLAETAADALAPTIAATVENMGVPESIATLASELDKANAQLAALHAKIQTAEKSFPALAAIADVLKKWFPHEAGLISDIT